MKIRLLQRFAYLDLNPGDIVDAFVLRSGRKAIIQGREDDDHFIVFEFEIVPQVNVENAMNQLKEMGVKIEKANR